MAGDGGDGTPTRGVLPKGRSRSEGPRSTPSLGPGYGALQMQNVVRRRFAKGHNDIKPNPNPNV